MRDTAQYMSALADANRSRLAQADVKHEIADGTLTVADALTDPRAQTMRIGDLLTSQHRWGTTRTNRLLAQVMIGERRKVRDLTDRQQHLIVAALSGDYIDDFNIYSKEFAA